MEIDVKNLHPLEVKVLRAVSPDDTISGNAIEKKLQFKTGQFNQAVSWLSAKGFICEKERKRRVFYEITDLGREFLEKGTPEERLVALVKERGPLSMAEIAQLIGADTKDVGSAYGQLSKEGTVTMDSEKKVKFVKDSAFLSAVRSLLSRAGKEGFILQDALSASEAEIMNSMSRKRGASSSPFRLVEREEVAYALTASGQEARRILMDKGITGEEIGVLTPEMLASGSWKHGEFRPYAMNVPPARVLLGRKNPYCDFLRSVKDKLTSLGFEEFDGPLVETEFWNSDALFMPQFHAARDIHDVYYVKHPTHAKEIEQPYLDQVAKTHENGWKTGSRGWGYDFDRNFTRRLILRSQGTVLSAKTLPKAKIPGKYFGIVRCFRYDKVDATHLSDFYQTEGIVLSEEVSLRTLLGLLEMFAVEVAGAKEVKYVPGYFPFTEPSVEVHIKHPVLGWFELGGSGIFRPEVTEPLGIHVPVLAWGLGIDRMALMSLGLDDLRELFSQDLEHVRLRRRG